MNNRESLGNEPSPEQLGIKTPIEEKQSIGSTIFYILIILGVFCYFGYMIFNDKEVKDPYFKTTFVISNMTTYCSDTIRIGKLICFDQSTNETSEFIGSNYLINKENYINVTRKRK